MQCTNVRNKEKKNSWLLCSILFSSTGSVAQISCVSPSGEDPIILMSVYKAYIQQVIFFPSWYFHLMKKYSQFLLVSYLCKKLTTLIITGILSSPPSFLPALLLLLKPATKTFLYQFPFMPRKRITHQGEKNITTPKKKSSKFLLKARSRDRKRHLPNNNTPEAWSIDCNICGHILSLQL